MGTLFLRVVSLVSALMLTLTGFGSAHLEADPDNPIDPTTISVSPDTPAESIDTSANPESEPESEPTPATIYIVPSEVMGAPISAESSDPEFANPEFANQETLDPETLDLESTRQETPKAPTIKEGFALALTDQDETFELTAEDISELSNDELSLENLNSGDEVILALSGEEITEIELLDPQNTTQQNPEAANPEETAAPANPTEAAAPAPTLPSAPYTHSVDVLVLNDVAGLVTQQVAEDAIGRLRDFWLRESNGAISQISMPRFHSATSPNPCDANATWNTAESIFGTTDITYLGKNTKRHLIVLASNDDCGGGGLATVGPSANPTAANPNATSLTNGGLIWASVDYSTPLYWQQVLAHEFGHNLSLSHANARLCSSPHNDGAHGKNGCINEEYKDYFDVMGRAWVITSGPVRVVATSEENLPALNSLNKVQLGIFKVGNEVSRVNTAPGTRSATLNATSSSGVRGLSVTDPKTGEEFIVEYRSGTGFEQNSFYKSSNLTATTPGVRVLKRETPSVSTPQATTDTLVLTKVLPSRFYSEPFSKTHGQSFAVGERFTSYNGTFTMTVKSMNSTRATVEFSFAGKQSTAAYKPAKTRVAGADRYATSVEVSRVGFPKKAPVVYIATGANYPDALAAGPVAAAAGGPLLLVPNSAAGLDGVIAKRLRELDPSSVVVIGGTGAVSSAVLNRVKQILPRASVKRIGGSDRYDTALRVVEDSFKGQTVDEVIVATGTNFPDALAASGAAGARNIPVILVNGGAKKLDANTAALLKRLRVKTVYIAGGSGVVSSGIETSLRASFKTVRLGGADRYSTSQLINKKLFEGNNPDSIFFATGMNFPDALAASAVAGYLNAPLEVVPSNCVPQSTMSFLTAKRIPKVYVAGGKAVLSDSVLNLKPC